MKTIIKSFILLLILLLTQACTESKSIESTFSAQTATPFSTQTPTKTIIPSATITLTKTITSTQIPSPTRTAIPEDLKQQIRTYYNLMLITQIHSELVTEAANRVINENFPVEDAFQNINDSGYGITPEVLEDRIQQLTSENITIPGSLAEDWSTIKDAQNSASDVLSRWMEKDITSDQVLVEMDPIKALIEETIVNVEEIIGQIWDMDSDQLTKERQNHVLSAINRTFPLAACAGEGLNTDIVKKEGRLAFVSNRDGNPEIYVINADGTGLLRLTNHPAGDYNPAWSPDGKRIAFYSERDGNAEIYVVNVDGTGLTRLTNDPANDYNPSWSPDGMKITFHSHRYLGACRIFVMNADGSKVQRLTDPSFDDFTPVWSPDGLQIMFISTRGPSSDIWVMSSYGTNKKNLTNNSVNEDRPAWSPDGEWIVYDTVLNESLDIYMMTKTGKQEQRITDDPHLEYDPSWSPDGSRISYTSDRSGNFEICVMNVDGKGIYNLTNNKANDWAATWQPEGDTLQDVQIIEDDSLQWVQINTDGFGNPANKQIPSLTEFKGHLYAGVWQSQNADTYAEVWRTDGSSWERVDHRRINGCAALIAYKEYLYCGSWGHENGKGRIWRSVDGLSWTEDVNYTSEGIARFAEYNERLFASTWGQTGVGTKIWVSDNGVDWELSNTPGFNDNHNLGAISSEIFLGKLYWGTMNPQNGAQIWRTNGISYEQVMRDGFGSVDNSGISALATFVDYLFAVTADSTNIEVYRSADGMKWENVFILPMYRYPLGEYLMNGLEVYDGYLYLVGRNDITGLEVWRTANGTKWTQVSFGGFADANNHLSYWDNGITIFQDKLFIATINQITGGEIWTFLPSESE